MIPTDLIFCYCLISISFDPLCMSLLYQYILVSCHTALHTSSFLILLPYNRANFFLMFCLLLYFEDLGNMLLEIQVMGVYYGYKTLLS
jgi:hypothetical protein